MGHLASVKNVPHEIIWWAPAALMGGLLGSELGSRRLAPMTMRRLLAVVLVVAGVKMLVVNAKLTSNTARSTPDTALRSDRALALQHTTLDAPGGPGTGSGDYR